MKKIIVPIIFIILTGLIILNQNKEKEVITQVITYKEEIDKINETCHLKNNKFDLELNIEFLNSTDDNKIIIYGNEIEEFNNYLYQNYYLENKIINLTLNNFFAICGGMIGLLLAIIGCVVKEHARLCDGVGFVT